jgi:hypothetical protein
MGRIEIVAASQDAATVGGIVELTDAQNAGVLINEKRGASDCSAFFY